MHRWSDCEFVTFGRDAQAFRDEHGLRYRVVRDLRRHGHATDPLSPEVLRLLADYDSVHFFVHNKIALIGALYARMRGARCFMTPLGGGGRAGMGKLGTYRAFDGFPMISDYTEVVYPWVSFRPTTVMYGGGDAAGFGAGEVSTVSRRSDRVVCVGRISAHKGIDVLIEALPAGAELVVCGENLDREYAFHLRALAKGKRVEFLAPGSDAEVSELYASATVSVLPSVVTDFRGRRHEHPELLGLVLLEAMWHSTPVIGSKIGAISEVIADGVNGLLVEPGQPALWRDAIIRLLSDPPRAAGMGREGRRMVEERFTWDHVTGRALAFYQALGAERPARRRALRAPR